MLNGTIRLGPKLCVDSKCRRYSFTRDVAKHIAVDHDEVPRTSAQPGQFVRVNLGEAILGKGIAYQHVLMVDGLVRNFGCPNYEDTSAIMIASSWISDNEIFSNNNEFGDNDKYLILWATGLVPPEAEIHVTMSLCEPIRTTTGILYEEGTGHIVDYDNHPDPIELYSNGQNLLIFHEHDFFSAWQAGDKKLPTKVKLDFKPLPKK